MWCDACHTEHTGNDVGAEPLLPHFLGFFGEQKFKCVTQATPEEIVVWFSECSLAGPSGESQALNPAPPSFARTCTQTRAKHTQALPAGVVNMLLVTAAYTASAPPADPSPSSLALHRRLLNTTPQRTQCTPLCIGLSHPRPWTPRHPKINTT